MNSIFQDKPILFDAARRKEKEMAEKEVEIQHLQIKFKIIFEIIIYSYVSKNSKSIFLTVAWSSCKQLLTDYLK